jgi:hypothetical protein
MKKDRYLTNNKVLEVIVGILLLSMILISILLVVRGFYLSLIQFVPVSWIFILATLFLIFVIFYLIRSLTNKYIFKYYSFHFDFLKYSHSIDLSVYCILLCLLYFPSVAISQMYFSDATFPAEGEIMGISIILLCFSILLFSYGLLNRVYVKDIFPVSKLSLSFLNDNHALQLVVNYDDFINKKIDKPCLTIGQDFLITIIDYPRNEEEKHTVMLMNTNTSPNPSIVTVIISKELADGLRNNEFILKTKLKSISDFTKLEIAVWLVKNN